jgi:glycine cleavage system H protein
MYPKSYFYTKTHEYVKMEGNVGYIGLTHFAQDQLGDIVFAELPEIGREVRQGETFGVVESVKAVSDCYSPVSGKVVKTNDKVVDAPDLVNKDPHGEGWMIAVEIADAGELGNLMTGEEYEAFPKEPH